MERINNSSYANQPNELAMKKTVDINIGNRAFHIDEDAYTHLKQYLERLNRLFNKQEGGSEIITDIEIRIAELFETKINSNSGVISMQMVDEVINIMGQPEDLDDDNGDAKKEEKVYYAKVEEPKKRFYRDIDNRVIAGICAGLAAYFNMDIAIIRIIAVILFFVTSGGAIPVYIILWLIIPPAISRAQKMEMRGERVTIENIERTIREEYEEMKKGFEKFKKSSTYKKGESWFKRMSKNDKSYLIAVGLLGLAMLFSGFTFAVPATMSPNLIYTPTMGHIVFPGFVALAAILIGLGLIFKVAIKIILAIILGIVILSVLGNIGLIIVGILFIASLTRL